MFKTLIPNQQDIGPLCPQARLTEPTMQDRWCEERNTFLFSSFPMSTNHAHA
jgi:hypothetical protein